METNHDRFFEYCDRCEVLQVKMMVLIKERDVELKTKTFDTDKDDVIFKYGKLLRPLEFEYDIWVSKRDAILNQIQSRIIKERKNNE